MKISRKVCWLLLLAASLTTILLPHPTLAQKERAGLTLWLHDGRYPCETSPGQDNAFFLEVRNTGTLSITNIMLTSEKPEGWTIEFKPTQINYLSPGSVQTVYVNIKPSGNGKPTKADYKVTLIAEANEIRTVQTVSITVKPAPFWIWIWAILGVVMVAGFVFIFMRFGRQQT